MDWIAIPMAVVKHNVRIVFCHSTAQLIGFGGGSRSTMGCEGGGCTKLSPSDSGSMVCGGGGCTEVSPSELRSMTVCEGAGCPEVSPGEFGPSLACVLSPKYCSDRLSQVRCNNYDTLAYKQPVHQITETVPVEPEACKQPELAYILHQTTALTGKPHRELTRTVAGETDRMNDSAGWACCGCLPLCLWHCAIAEWSHFVNYGYYCGPRDFWRIKDGGLMMATGFSNLEEVWLLTEEKGTLIVGRRY
ncbi:hypothetical protein CFP56_028712 [Quercus suber]|uniref:Uncharacterized protein n=1 Tax=Quercus suber TaxID=58331 RepID=A0AAW0LWN7_QUESU